MANSYKEFMTEYLSLRPMELVSLKDRNSPNSFYLPHLAVYKHTAEGPKIRVVYDCSAKSSNEFLNTCTKFNFIPARSPHFGGLWERCVQSVKHHLRIAYANRSLFKFASLDPTIPRSQRPGSVDPWSFFNRSTTHGSLRKRRNGSQHQRPHEVATDHPTPAALLEKVSQLQTRPRGQQHQHPNLDVGALVVLVEDNLPPLQWRLGRVVHVHPGRDGVVRVVSVKTVSGTYKRAVKKLCIIPTEVT
jgi:hypothetical protein